MPWHSLYCSRPAARKSMWLKYSLDNMHKRRRNCLSPRWKAVNAQEYVNAKVALSVVLSCLSEVPFFGRSRPDSQTAQTLNDRIKATAWQGKLWCKPWRGSALNRRWKHRRYAKFSWWCLSLLFLYVSIDLYPNFRWLCPHYHQDAVVPLHLVGVGDKNLVCRWEAESSTIYG